MCSASKRAVHMTAGHDEAREPGPNQSDVPLRALPWVGLPDSRIDRVAITSQFTLTLLKAPAGAGRARLVYFQDAAGIGKSLRMPTVKAAFRSQADAR